jgi:hypothetical protein
VIPVCVAQINSPDVVETTCYLTGVFTKIPVTSSKEWSLQRSLEIKKESQELLSTGEPTGNNPTTQMNTTFISELPRPQYIRWTVLVMATSNSVTWKTPDLKTPRY